MHNPTQPNPDPPSLPSPCCVLACFCLLWLLSFSLARLPACLLCLLARALLRLCVPVFVCVFRVCLCAWVRVWYSDERFPNVQERLTAYAGMLDWEPIDLDEEEPKEKSLDDLNEE